MFNKIDKLLKDYQSIQTEKKRIEKAERELKKLILDTYYESAPDHRISGSKYTGKMSIYYTPYAAAGSIDFLREVRPELVKDKENTKITVNEL